MRRQSALDRSLIFGWREKTRRKTDARTRSTVRSMHEGGLLGFLEVTLSERTDGRKEKVDPVDVKMSTWEKNVFVLFLAFLALTSSAAASSPQNRVLPPLSRVVRSAGGGNLTAVVDLLDRLYGPNTFPNHFAFSLTNTILRTSSIAAGGKMFCAKRTACYYFDW